MIIVKDRPVCLRKGAIYSYKMDKLLTNFVTHLKVSMPLPNVVTEMEHNAICKVWSDVGSVTYVQE